MWYVYFTGAYLGAGLLLWYGLSQKRSFSKRAILVLLIGWPLAIIAGIFHGIGILMDGKDRPS